MISQKRERGREEKSKSRDLSNRSLKTDWDKESGEPKQKSLEREREGKRARAEIWVSEDRWGDREQRAYMGIDIRKTSLKTDRETESGDPT